MIVDCISDLHGFHPKLEGGDLLIVAGDLTARDTIEEYEKFGEWLAFQKYRKKVVIPGNHDNQLTESRIKQINRVIGTLNGCVYLCDSGTEFEGLKIWGSPWTLTFEGMNPHCKAFTVDTEDELAEKWAMIPDDVDILITHSPRYGVLDYIHNYNTGVVERVGSKTLTKKTGDFTNLQLHVYGHIHEAYGSEKILFRLGSPDDEYIETCVNASHVDEHYQPKNPPIRVTL